MVQEILTLTLEIRRTGFDQTIHINCKAVVVIYQSGEWRKFANIWREVKRPPCRILLGEVHILAIEDGKALTRERIAA